MALTQAQKTGLEAAILAYLAAEGTRFARTAAAFKEEMLRLPHGEGIQVVSAAVLEKAWTLSEHVVALDAAAPAAAAAAAAPASVNAMSGPLRYRLWRIQCPSPGPHAEDPFGSDNMRQQLSPLHAAVSDRDAVRVHALVESGADIEETLVNKDGETRSLLHHAAEKGIVEVARCLVERGADKESKDDTLKTPLHIAAMHGHLDVVRMLIEHGASRTGYCLSGPFMWAAAHGHVAVVEYLLELGCDVDVGNRFTWCTALHHAAERGRLEVANLLLRWGASLDVRDTKGRTPADLATIAGHQRIADAIRAAEIRRRDQGFKRDRSTIEGTEEHAAAKRPRTRRPMKATTTMSEDGE